MLPAVANSQKAPKLDANLAGPPATSRPWRNSGKLAFAEQVPEPASADCSCPHRDAAEGEDEE